MIEKLNNWGLSRKLGVGFAIIALLMGLLGTVSVYSDYALTRAADSHVEISIPATKSVSDTLEDLREYRIIMYSHMTAISAEETASLEKRVTDTKAKVDEHLAALRAASLPDIHGRIDLLGERIEELEAVNERALALSRQGQKDEMLQLLKADGRDASHDALGEARKLMDLIQERAFQRGADAHSLGKRAMLAISLIGILALALLIYIWSLLTRTVASPMATLAQTTSQLAAGRDAEVPSQDRADELGEIARAVEQFRQAAVARATADAETAAGQRLVSDELGKGLSAVAAGDLTVQITAEFPREVASLRTDFNTAIGTLREMIAAANTSTLGIRSSSREIAQAAEDLARRTESNAANLEETAAAIAQINERIQGTAVSADRTVERTRQAISTVSNGRTVAVEAVGAMERVAESAKGIDQVIEGVDKIAFQTRVLAMNAAVEAGRAGDAGRGFAVVADLVSALAMRAEEEAKRARDQLTVTQTDIGSAVGAVQRVDGALETISGGVSEVHELVEDMAESNRAQSAAITQINVAMAAMDRATQQNAAMVEEASAAARNLTDDAELLSRQAAMFQTGQSQGAAPAPRAAPARSAAPLRVVAGSATATASAARDEDWSTF